MPDIDPQSLNYLLAAQRPPQWNELLSLLGEELGAQLGRPQLRALFRTLGRRLAAASPLASDSVPQMQQAINTWLLARGWGWVRIIDCEEWLALEHRCGPLRAAFGDEGLRWSAALLEGLYAGWFKAAGADERLDLRQHGEPQGPDDCLQFRFAHHRLLESLA